MTKNFKYDEETFDAALEIMEHISFKRKRNCCITVFGTFAVPCILRAVFLIVNLHGTAEFLIWTCVFWGVLGAVFLGFGVACGNSYRKAYEKRNPTDGYCEKQRRYSGYVPYVYRSPERIFSLDNGFVSVYAELCDLNDISRKITRKEKLNKYMFKNCRINENDIVFLIYKNENENDAVGKKFFTAEEIEQLQKIFSEKIGNRYTKLL